MEIKSQKDFFNSVASSWDQTCNHNMEKVEKILDLSEIKKGDHVLDVGTGTGVLIPSLYRRVGSTGYIKAVDIAENMINLAKKKNVYINVNFECRDILEINGSKDLYDHVICYSMFPHFKSRKQEAILILAGKLKVGGQLIICHSQSRDDINNLHKGVEEPVKDDNLPTMDLLKIYFKDAGLKVVKALDHDEMFVIIGHS